MRTPRVYVDRPLAPSELDLSEQASFHLVQVLRLRAGDPLVLFNGDGYDYPARLLNTGRSGTRVRIDVPGPPEEAPPLALHLGLGISKGERMDFALQKAVELGVTRVTPLVTERTVVRLEGERRERRGRHWWGLIVAACEQSGRRRLPVLDPAAGLGDWLAGPHKSPLLLDPHGAQPLTATPPPTGAVSLLVGPEGGLSDAERAAATAAGFLGVRLGPRILRTETAPLAALAVIQALWGDLGR
ncbi:MAG: 16S rRNA (uracil(1498)-N(3))-methyltransferase [Chromatiaceae bacterium]|jgi:16S rRNA (uracil1498-N3)-methyltransferase|nr:16S rRNA (uracil(1498)-N(3))-methyltransferase [Chromatiaceae bacterium]